MILQKKQCVYFGNLSLRPSISLAHIRISVDFVKMFFRGHFICYNEK